MKKWLRILFLPIVLSLLTAGLYAGRVSAAETTKIIRTLQVNAEGKVFIPRIQGMADIKTQEMLNNKIKDSIFALNNSLPGSSLNGDFTVSFYNQKLLGIHFTGYSFTPRAAHPNKIDRGIHIDLTTGQIYQLADLFAAGVEFEKRIKEQCTINSERYRQQTEGLWDGWTNETFLSSWQGVDMAFLLSDKTVRVYSIPSYATGAISGYNVPYADLIDIVNTQSSLWKKIQSSPPSAILVLPDNVIDKTDVKVGEVYAGLTVAKLEIRNGYLMDARFTGEKELVGVSEWFDNIGDGAGYVFTVNDIYADSLPVLKGYKAQKSFVLKLGANSPTLPKEKIGAKIIVDDFSIGERQLTMSAQLVQIVSLDQKSF